MKIYILKKTIKIFLSIILITLFSSLFNCSGLGRKIAKIHYDGVYFNIDITDMQRNLEIFYKGSKSWNQYRKNSNYKRIYFYKIDFNNMKIVGYNFKNVHFYYCFFKNCYINTPKFYFLFFNGGIIDCKIENTLFKGRGGAGFHLARVVMKNSCIDKLSQGATILDVKVYNSKIHINECDKIKGSDFKNTEIMGSLKHGIYDSSFSKCNLNISVEKTEIEYSKFFNSHFEICSFTNSIVKKCKFKKIKFTSVALFNTKIKKKWYNLFSNYKNNISGFNTIRWY